MNGSRACLGCGAPLSRFNRDAMCAACSDSGRASRSSDSWLRAGNSATPAPVRGSVGTLLRDYRAAHGLTQAELADRLGFDQSYISKVESGRRELRDLDALRRIASVLEVSPGDLGLCREAAPAAAIGRDADMADAITQSQRTWRLVREHLNRSRAELAQIAAGLYDERFTGSLRAPLLVRSGWLAREPIEFARVALRWTSDVGPARVTGSEDEASAALPLRGPGQRFHRYTRAVRDLDRPSLFESRASFRLIEFDGSDPDSPQLQFGHTTYFDMVDVCELAAHELASVHMTSRPVEWSALPFRRHIGDPFDLHRRPLLPSINTLTIRRDGRSGSFVLHDRDSSHVALAGGMYHVMPAGVFQPSSISPLDQVNDFDLWRNVMREYSEEFLGCAEHDGSSGEPIDYDGVEPLRSLNAARRAGGLRIVWLGLGLDPLTLAGEILAAAIIDAEVFDDVFSGLVPVNAEGSIVTTRGSTAVGIPFEHRNVERLLVEERMAPSAAACLELAWRHRDTLLAT
jgi:transcriptional regulator with XRE-family HTH domain